MEDDYMLIGIGCNIMQAPVIEMTGREHGRPATALLEYSELTRISKQYQDQLKLRNNTSSSSSSNTDNNIHSSVEVTVDSTGKTPAAVSTTPAEETTTQQPSANEVISPSVPPTYYKRDSSELFNERQLQYPLHKRIGVELANHMSDWIEIGTDTPSRIIEDFQNNMDFSIQYLRDQLITETGEPVEDREKAAIRPLVLNKDGSLRVRHVDTQEEMNLLAEYLF
jgi:hypothetical protein